MSGACASAHLWVSLSRQVGLGAAPGCAVRGVCLSLPAGVDKAEDVCPGFCSCHCRWVAGQGGLGPRGPGCDGSAPAMAGHVSLHVPACASPPPPENGCRILAQGPAALVSPSPWVTLGVWMGVNTHTFMPVSVLARGGGNWQKNEREGWGGEGKGQFTPSPNARRHCHGVGV